MTEARDTISKAGSKPVIDVSAGILRKDGRFLAVRRPEGKPMAGFWEFPGGKVEPGENPEQALIRELKEELNIVPHGLSLRRVVEHEYDHLNVRLHFFEAGGFAGRPEPLEGQTLAWLTPQEARNEPFLEADTQIVRELDE